MVESALGVAVFVDPNALDVFHGEEGDVARGDAGAIELRDIWVIEARQDSLFVAKPGDDFRGVHSRAHEFQRDLAAQFRVLREIHLAHAADADARKNLVVIDLPQRRQFRIARASVSAATWSAPCSMNWLASS